MQMRIHCLMRLAMRHRTKTNDNGALVELTLTKIGRKCL